MARRLLPVRSRAIDLALLVLALALLATPFIPTGRAAAPVLERGVSVDQKVKASASISLPLEGDIQIPRSGRSIGSVKWDVYTTSKQGYKLTVASKASPALWDDASSNAVVDDYHRGDPKGWSVGAGDRRFGFSASGPRTLSAFESGSDQLWRGFEGKKGLEVARFRNGAAPTSRTTLWVASEMRNPLPASAKMNGLIIATAMINL